MSKSNGEFRRGRRGRAAALLGVCAAAGLALVYAAIIPTGETLSVGSKATPLALAVVSSSTLPPEVQAQESATAANLFDRDTTTEHVVFAASQVEAVFESPQDVRAIKLFGAAPYTLTVQADTTVGYQSVAGLENLNLTGLPTGWTTFEATAPVNAARLLFTLTPVSGATATGLRELEIWTTAAPVTVKDGTALLARLLGPSPPPQGRIYHAFSPTATPNEGVIAPGERKNDTPDNFFNFTLDRDPAQFVRAYLTYELFGQAHWVSARRNINGIMSNAGGTLILPNPQWSTQVERINPAWFELGSNTIEFSVLSSSFKDAGYTVRNVRVVFELDTGANMVDRITVNQPDSISTNPIEALYDGDTATGWKPYPADQPINAIAPSVEFDFYRPTQMEAAAFYLSGPLVGQLQVSVKQNGQWVDFPPEDGAVINAGWNTLFVPATVPLEQRVFEAVKLTFLGGFVSDAEIREFLFVGSGAGGRFTPPRIVMVYPDAGQFHGRQAYFQGFLEPWNNGSGSAAITVGNETASHFRGTITRWLSKDQLGFANQADNDPWSVEVKAVFPDGETVTQIVELTEQQSQAVPLSGTLAGTGTGTFFAKRKKTVAHDESKLAAAAGTVATDTTVTITPLDEENLPALDVGMTNVTKGPRRGYRFLPHGAKFLKNVDLALPYDKALIPPGHTEDDVKTFYFEETTGRWIELERVSVDKTTKVVNSLTDHFTDMINATVTVPDHPQTVSFNPTSIKDIKAADPGAGINLIEVPQANNTGDARLSYPIEVPPGRAGIQPQLAVQYNSSGGNGWMGMGWDLPVQSITIDTRWGVPRYEGGLETETYMLNGEMLTPVAHRGELQPRTAEKIFRTRVEGQFRRIIRHGTTPSTYWWEVIDKNGIKSIFGGNLATNTLDATSVLADPANGNVFKWMLREMRDPNGNSMRYENEVVTFNTPGQEPWRQIYLTKIRYTGSNGLDGPYEVSFNRGGGRPDVTIDGRPGFKTVLDQRLNSIDVRLTTEANSLIRRYIFVYDNNPYGDDRPGTAFNKTLLTAIVQQGEDGITEFNRHTFTYFDEARDVAGNHRGFAPSSNWSIGNDGIGIGLLGQGTASALGGSQSTSAGGHIYIGVGPVGNTSSKQATAGPKVGFSRSRSETLIAMADMNGDGLPDKVFRGGSGFFHRPNLSGPNGATSFGPPVPLPTLPAISRERVTSITFGAEAFFGVPVLIDTNRSTSQADVYFSDVNGDGLTDLVSGGQVLFGFINPAGVPTFSANSADTPVSVGAGAIITDGLLEDAAAIEAERAANFPLLDTLRRWVAPYDGVVTINAPVQLIEATSPERAQADGADGVRVAIQLEGTELWADTIAADDFLPRLPTPTAVNAVPVSRGQRLYFRVQPIFNGEFDQVAWDPEITYASVDTTRTDVNSLPEFIYRASGDFTLFGRRATVTVPLTGTLHLDGTFEKTGVTTDDVTLVITQNGTEVSRNTLGFAATATVPLAQDLLVTQLDVLEWRILVDSPIDASKVKLLPTAFYTAATGVDSVTDDQGNFVIKVDPPFDMDLYPVNVLTAPQGFHSVPLTPPAPLPPLPVQVRLQLSGLSTGAVADAVFTVKRRGALLVKRPIRVTGAGMVEPDEVIVTADVAVAPGDQLFFDVTARDPLFASKLALLEARVGTDSDNDGLLDTIVPSALHTPAAEGLFPQPYRGWGAAGYNGNPPRDTLPIDQTVLVLNSSFDPDNARAYPFAPRPAEFLWGGVDEFAWVKAAEVSASRLGLDDIRAPRSEQFAGASAVPRISRSTNISVSLGIGASTGDSQSQLEFQDLNGDRFPDVISSNGGVQFSRAVGGLEAGRRGSGPGSARKSNNESFNAGTSGLGSIATAIASARGSVAPTGTRPAPTGSQGSDMPSLGFGGDIGFGSSDTERDLIDINGDGLPDKVFESGAVQLNLGYRFGLAESWGGGIVNNGETLNAGVNLGFNIDAYSIAGGLNLGIGTTRSDETYADINGDGLPDKIVAGSPLTVRLNTGSGFAGSIPWPGGQGNVAVNKNISLGGGLYFTVGFNIPIPPIRFVFNPGVNFSTSMGRPEVGFRDLDGDGFTDHVFSERDSQLQVALNPIGRTNLLKSVQRPLGASVDVEYTRDGNTFNLPQSRWTMTKVTVDDGHAGEGADTQITTYQYTSPKFDRLEREFYGYATVQQQQLDTQKFNSLFRTTTREFLTNSYYTKGLFNREIVQDALGRPFAETENTYLVRDEDTGLPLANLQSTIATGFPQLTRTDRRFFEGQVSPGKTTFTTQEYDEFGNVIRLIDAGDLGAIDDTDTTIAYTNCRPAYIIQPNRVTVTGGGVIQRQREATIDCTTGNVTQVRQFLADLSAATTDLTYFANGNIQSVIGPTNKVAQRYTLTFEYDTVVNTHVARITDSFGLSSQATHNFKQAKVETTIDTNANQTTNFYDVFGRLDQVIGPYEQGQAIPTIDFEYKPDAAVPHAITRHVDKDAIGASKPSGTIDTILFTDGLKRVLQTKKDASVLAAGKTFPDDVMIVSGQVTFNAFGRTVTLRYPTTEAKSSDTQNGTLNPVADTEPPTTMEYDVLDRNTKTTIPDGTFTTITYGFGTDRAGATQFETVVRDANVNGGLTGAVKHSFRDVRELITSVKEFNNALPTWTSYDYDALKQITKVTDDKGNVTTVTYDNFGRRTSIDNPDVGKTETIYDLASNVTRRITANLRTTAQAIEYDYDIKRLSAIRYPVNVGNNVTYTYGLPGAPGNAAGRITRITSQMGVEERQYGKLGETVFEKKTVNTFTSPLKPEVYETRFAFDTFGRLLRLTYPDGEVLTNTYDSGGNLNSAKGEKAVAASGQNHRYQYLHKLFYDKFEQRVLMEQGNGITTAHTYDAKTRRLNNLTAQKNNGEQFQNLVYTYDKVGNITNLANQVAIPPPNKFGGPTQQNFAYDNLYRLTSAFGTFQFSPQKTHRYDFAMQYDSIHNITQKTQAHVIVQPSGTSVTQKKTTYDFAYAYNLSGPTSIRPHAPNHIGDRTYTYDANGNQTGWTHDRNGTRRTIVWDEENRIQSLFDNGHEKTYKYDDQGNRAIKRGPQGETVYVNQFFTSRPGANGTKHIYAGTARIASKLMRQNVPNSNPNGKTPFEKDLYFYHPDHLGTSNYITDLNAKLYEHLEYFPFGEAWVEENSNTQRTPYLFTAKELDEETGLYYYGARYYDPRTSVWQSGDPILGRYVNGKSNGGVFIPKNLGLYSYTLNNPLIYNDPDGLFSLKVHREITAVAFAGWTAAEIKKASEGVTRIDTFGIPASENGIVESVVGLLGPIFGGGRHFDFKFGSEDSRDNFRDDQFIKAVNFLQLGQREEAAGALGEGLHSIQDKWAHSFLKEDASGNVVRREVGWWEHLGRSLLGIVQKLIVGKDTFSPDSPDSDNFAERRAAAQAESIQFVRDAEAEAEADGQQMQSDE